MIFEHTDYRAYLKATLAERTEQNPSYSLNAWARKLGVAQGFFSEVLNGKKNLSQEAALRVAHRLGLSAAETEYFALLVQCSTTKDPEIKEKVVERLGLMRPKREINNLEVDVFRAISDWYHLPILELSLTTGFEVNAKNVAKRLGISHIEAEAAIDRLVRLDLLSKDSQGRYVKTDDDLLIEATVPSSAIQKFHRQMLEKASAALPLSKEERKSRTEVVPISPEILPEVERILDETAQRISDLAKSSVSKSQVYTLSLHFFPLTQDKKGP